MRPCGGDEEVRTPDPLRARQVLSQLSYTPELFTLRALKMSLDTLKIEQHSAASAKPSQRFLAALTRVAQALRPVASP